mmetsp:Transcript_3900/g.14522  ORF Transcript_3900/g.14522 Transcript_3900/m.14522 type:complete len:460 (-) Transcript_3900:44-1423(-)
MASLLKKFEYAGKEGKPAADAAAKELRKSKDFVQRRFAITALGTLGPEAAPWMDALLMALSDEDRGVRYHAAITMGTLGEALVTHSAALAKALADEDPGIRLYIVEALGGLGEKVADQADALMEALRSDDDTHVRLAATRALLRVRPTSGEAAAAVFALELRALEEELRDEVFYRQCATEGLAILGDIGKPHAGLLRQALEDKFHGVRAAAALALAGLGADEVRPGSEVLARLAKDDPNEGVRKAASGALGRLEPADALKSDDSSMRYWAVSTLAGDASAAEPRAAELAGMLQDPETANRHLAAVALEGIRQAATPYCEALLASLSDPDASVRIATMKALIVAADAETIGRALEVVAGSLKSSEASLRAAAAECMACTGLAAKPHTEGLIETLGDEEFPVRLQAVRALEGAGRMAVRECGAKLAKLALEDPDIDVRRAATGCLREFRLDKRFGLPDQTI